MRWKTINCEISNTESQTCIFSVTVNWLTYFFESLSYHRCRNHRTSTSQYKKINSEPNFSSEVSPWKAWVLLWGLFGSWVRSVKCFKIIVPNVFDSWKNKLLYDYYYNVWGPLKIYENLWSSLKMPEQSWTLIKISARLWKCLNITENYYLNSELVWKPLLALFIAEWSSIYVL